jgi:formylmethanofuran dehydrogenase subunit A
VQERLMQGRYRLVGGRVHDPTNGVDGDVADVWIENGRIVARPEPAAAAGYVAVDCSGRVIMPGGIDLHSHIAGPKVNLARRLQPELFEPGCPGVAGGPGSGHGTLPTIARTAGMYLGMGYTTVMDAAVAPSAARQFHAELEQFPVLDAGCYILTGNHHAVLDCVARGDHHGLRDLLGWLLWRCGGYAPKVVNPGGVEQWKRHRGGNAMDLDQTVDGWNASPRSIIQAIARAANEAALPHPLHLHCNNLGLPGNWQTTLETMRSLDGLRAHFAHVQFHSYGGRDADPRTIRSMTGPLIEQVNQHPELSVDVGQVLFGKTTSLTADAPLAQWLGGITRAKTWLSSTEAETGCGISPIEYRDRDLLNCVQWAAGLEWFLGVGNPWQVVLSTDHPNGASFLAYPHLIRLLMDREFRREQVRRLPPRLLKRSSVAEFDREYTLNEIAIVTRAGPARLLGFHDKGHLGHGAVADIAIYTPDSDRERMFQLPWRVFKSGVPVFVEGELQPGPLGKTHTLTAWQDSNRSKHLEKTFDRLYSFRSHHLGREAEDAAFSRSMTGVTAENRMAENVR